MTLGNELVRGQILAGVRDSAEYGSLKKTINLWDLSGRPKGNNRGSKLGFYASTHGGAVLSFDPTTKMMRTGDGINGFITRRMFEPDNWMLRGHSNSDVVWALRLVLDHENDSDQDEHRGTMVINQTDPQHWAWLDDILGHVQRDTDVNGKGLKLNGAGFPSFLVGGGKDTRDALAIWIAKNAGFVSDSSNVGQLYHILCFDSQGGAAPVPTPTTKNTPTTGGGGGAGPSRPPEDIPTQGASQSNPSPPPADGKPPSDPNVPPAKPGPVEVTPNPFDPPTTTTSPDDIPPNDPIRTGKF